MGDFAFSITYGSLHLFTRFAAVERRAGTVLLPLGGIFFFTGFAAEPFGFFALSAAAARFGLRQHVS